MGLGRRLAVVVSSWLAGAFIGLGRRLGLLPRAVLVFVRDSEAFVWRFWLVRGSFGHLPSKGCC